MLLHISNLPFKSSNPFAEFQKTANSHIITPVLAEKNNSDMVDIKQKDKAEKNDNNSFGKNLLYFAAAAGLVFGGVKCVQHILYAPTSKNKALANILNEKLSSIDNIATETKKTFNTLYNSCKEKLESINCISTPEFDWNIVTKKFAEAKSQSEIFQAEDFAFENVNKWFETNYKLDEFNIMKEKCAKIVSEFKEQLMSEKDKAVKEILELKDLSKISPDLKEGKKAQRIIDDFKNEAGMDFELNNKANELFNSINTISDIRISYKFDDLKMLISDKHRYQKNILTLTKERMGISDITENIPETTNINLNIFPSDLPKSIQDNFLFKNYIFKQKLSPADYKDIIMQLSERTSLSDIQNLYKRLFLRSQQKTLNSGDRNWYISVGNIIKNIHKKSEEILDKISLSYGKDLNPNNVDLNKFQVDAYNLAHKYGVGFIGKLVDILQRRKSPFICSYTDSYLETVYVGNYKKLLEHKWSTNREVQYENFT